MVREKHPKLHVVQARLAAALRQVDAVRADWLPQVGAMAELVGSTTNNSIATPVSTSTVDLPRIGATGVGTHDMGPHPSTLVAMGVRQQLFDFGRVQAETAAARLLVEVERHRADDAALELQSAVALSYHAVIAARGVLDASRAAQARALLHRDRARFAVKTGMRPPIEVVRAEADVARFELGVLRASAGLATARTVFAAVCSVPDQQLDAAAEELLLPPLEPLERMYARARGHDPAVLAAQSVAAAQKARASASRARLRPRLYATASVSGRAGGATPTNGEVPRGDGWAPVVPNWNAGVVLTWPLVDVGSQRRAEGEALTGESLAWSAQDLARGRRAAVVIAYEEARVATEALDAVERAATAAALNYRYAEERFRVGMGNSVEIADAEALRVDAEVQRALARSQAAQSRVRLTRALAEEP